jgi:hypothetical protein
LAGMAGHQAGATGEQWIFVTFRILQLETKFLSRDRERQLTAQRRHFLEIAIFAQLENFASASARSRRCSR